MSAHADVSVGAAVGAGAQGGSAYSALELRLDAAWPSVRLGLGVRGVWDDSVFRGSEWSSAADAVTIIRALEAQYDFDDTRVSLAGGALAPAHIGMIADGYRIALDDRWRTGVRAAVQNED